MQRIIPLLLSAFLSANCFAQTKEKDVLWEDNFTSGIDPQVFPNLVSRYGATLRGTEGVMIVIPKDIYTTYDPNNFLGTSSNFRMPVRVVKSFSGDVVYDSIKLETTGTYFIDDKDVGWERYFSYSTPLTVGPYTYNATYTGKPYRMSNSRANTVKLLCKNCKEISLDGTINLYSNFERDIAFREIEATYANEPSDPYRLYRRAGDFIPINPNEFALPPQTPGKFSEMSTLYAMQDYFCQLCAKDIGNETRNDAIYFDCLQRSTIVLPNDYYIHFGLKGFKLVGYRSAVSTDLGQEGLQPEKKIVQAVDLMGRTIEDLPSYSGLVIVFYSDGSKRKLMK